MPALAPRAAPVFGAAADKQPMGATCGRMAREPARRVGDSEPAQKRARSSYDVKIAKGFAVCAVSVVVPAPAPRRLEERMEKELDAVHGLLNKAVLLSRGVAPHGEDGARTLTAKPRPVAPSVEAAAKRRKTLPSKPVPQAKAEKQPLAVHQRAVPAATQRAMSNLIDEAQKVLERRRLEEIARAREMFRLELLEMEKAAMPDETIYPEDLAELGLTAFQYAVTPTRKQAQRQLG